MNSPLREFKAALPLTFATCEETRRIRVQYKQDPSDEKSPRLSLLPSGAAAHKILLKGALIEVKSGDTTITGVFHDRTGRITLKASADFQPEAYGKLKTIRELPAFVAVVARINLFSPEPAEGQERQTFVSLIVEDIGRISKQDRKTWDIDVLNLTKERCTWGDSPTESQQRAIDLYGSPEELLGKIETAYQQAGVVI